MGTKEVLSDGEGCLIAKEFIADFSDKVWSVLMETRLRQRLTETAPGYVAKWSQERFGSRLVNFYHDLLGNKPGLRKPDARDAHSDNRASSLESEKREIETHEIARV